jgi:site-specific recombinase XerD
LQDHPDRSDPEAPLWSRLHKPDGLSYRMFKKILETTADRAGVDRPVTLTNFRKSSASHLASQGMSQAHIE